MRKTFWNHWELLHLMSQNFLVVTAQLGQNMWARSCMLCVTTYHSYTSRTLRKTTCQDRFPKYGLCATLSFHIHGIRTVSYTHLRAHETRHDLVCRLLLEKKKNSQR